MIKQSGYLVVGGDSVVGGGLLRALDRRGHPVLASTRRRETMNIGRVHLDFESEFSFRMPSNFDYAYIVAAATNYDRCDVDPMARRINTELIPKLVISLLEQGVFVTFISTNTVFGGERPWPNEDDPHSPCIAYARQKDEAEAVIRAAAIVRRSEKRLNIIRMTKILDRNTPPLPNWFSAWKRGEAVEPFSDLIFAPMSLRFVGESLAKLGEMRIPGDLHLSGAANVSYVDLAQCLARGMGIATSLILPTTAENKGVNIQFKPRFSGLGMQRTTAISGLTPQSIDDVARDIVEAICE